MVPATSTKAYGRARAHSCLTQSLAKGRESASTVFPVLSHLVHIARVLFP